MTFSHSTSWAGDPARAFDADRVLELLPCLRSLARRLVQDEAEAEDVARDALDRVARAGRPVDDPRRFGLGVVRNLALQRRRKDARRRHHEAARAAESAAEGDAPPADRIVERVELMGVVLEEIGKLTEAQSRVIGLRYLDELSVAEIAEREGSTPSTVRSHLSRGLQAVRERLDDRFGERAAWSSILVPWAFDPASLPGDAPTDAGGSTGLDAAQGAARATAGAFGGALATMTVLKTSLLVGALAAAGAYLAISDRGADSITPTLVGANDRATNDVVQHDGRRGSDPLQAPDAPSNAGARSAVATDSTETFATAETFPVEGRVVGARDGRGRLGIELEIHPLDEEHRGTTWRARTDDEGRFRVESTSSIATEVTIQYWTSSYGGKSYIGSTDAPVAFPFESDLVLDVEPVIRFDYGGVELPEDAVVRALPVAGPNRAPVIGAPYSTVQPARRPWVRFAESLPEELTTLRLEVSGDHLVGYAPVPPGEDRYLEPLPVTFSECGAIEMRSPRDELAGLNAGRLARIGDEGAPPIWLTFRRDEERGGVAAEEGHLLPGAYRWTVKLGDVEREGDVTVRAGETTVVDLEGFDWTGWQATVLIDASAVPDADPSDWMVMAFDESSPDRALDATLERVGGESSGLWHATVDDLPPGDWQVFMNVPNTLLVEPKMVRVEKNQVAGPFVVRAAAAAQTIQVRVLDETTGDPVAGASVWTFAGLEGGQLSRGKNGVFEDVEVSGDHTTQFFASADGYRLQQVDFVPGATPGGEALEFRLEKGWAGRVFVYDITAQDFAADLTVHVDGELRGRTGDDGVLWFEGDGAPERVEIGRGLGDQLEIVFDPFEAGVANTGATPGYVFAVRRP